MSLSMSPVPNISPVTPQSSSATPIISLNYIQLAKPFLTKNEISYMFNNAIKSDELLAITYKTKKREAFRFMIELSRALRFPTKILQNACFFYQRFYLLCDDMKKYLKSYLEISIACILVSLKMNDYIKKLNVVLGEANKILNADGDIDEQRRHVLYMEKKMMEFGSFDLRSYSVESFLIKFVKFYGFDKELCFLIWSICNDLYLTELTLQLPAHFNAMAVIELGVRIWNEVKKDSIKVDFNQLGTKISEENIISAVNEMLQFYLDNYDWSFIKTSLSELEISSGNISDSFINLKIEFSEKEDEFIKKSKTISNDESNCIAKDCFFKSRDTEIGKVGSLRFLYNRKAYMNELSHSHGER
ncbi:unnamed protein product [Ambrosiozyma monospora]|uniref:Unnamed protein product n=1 Tax=Ambrosiozyma monospora TaxID=43982 RepID=A0A9W6YWT8_AMBMO|nr:unnamed protein product [Ambrosiozyma monospora]